MTGPRLYQGLNGPEGLAGAIIAQAAIDYLGGPEEDRIDAALFLMSDWYRHLMCGLDMEPEFLPLGVDEVTLTQMSIYELNRQTERLGSAAEALFNAADKDGISKAELNRIVKRLDTIQAQLKAVHDAKRIR